MVKINEMNLIILSLILLFGCNFKSDKAKEPFDANDLPDTRPGDFEITYNTNGGMLQISESIYISKDSCYFKKQRYGNLIILKFEMSAAGLDSVYETVRKNKFDEIETYSEKVYDRGGTSVSVSYSGIVITKSNSGVSFIEKSWQKEYSTVTGMMLNIGKTVWDKNSRDFMVITDKSVKDETGYIMFDEYQIYKGDDEQFGTFDSGEMKQNFKLVDGTYSMNYKMMNDYGLQSIDITNHKGVRIFSKNGKLVWKMVDDE